MSAVLRDAPAYASGVYNVPTFFIGKERYAEQTYSVIRDAVERASARAQIERLLRPVPRRLGAACKRSPDRSAERTSDRARVG